MTRISRRSAVGHHRGRIVAVAVVVAVLSTTVACSDAGDTPANSLGSAEAWKSATALVPSYLPDGWKILEVESESDLTDRRLDAGNPTLVMRDAGTGLPGSTISVELVSGALGPVSDQEQQTTVAGQPAVVRRYPRLTLVWMLDGRTYAMSGGDLDRMREVAASVGRPERDEIAEPPPVLVEAVPGISVVGRLDRGWRSKADTNVVVAPYSTSGESRITLTVRTAPLAEVRSIQALMVDDVTEMQPEDSAYVRTYSSVRDVLVPDGRVGSAAPVDGYLNVGAVDPSGATPGVIVSLAGDMSARDLVSVAASVRPLDDAELSAVRRTAKRNLLDQSRRSVESFARSGEGRQLAASELVDGQWFATSTFTGPGLGLPNWCLVSGTLSQVCFPKTAAPLFASVGTATVPSPVIVIGVAPAVRTLEVRSGGERFPVALHEVGVDGLRWGFVKVEDLQPDWDASGAITLVATAEPGSDPIEVRSLDWPSRRVQPFFMKELAVNPLPSGVAICEDTGGAPPCP